MILVRGKSVSIVLTLLCLVCVPGLVTPFNQEVDTVDQKKPDEGSFIAESSDSKFTSFVKLVPSSIRALKKTTTKTKYSKKTKKAKKAKKTRETKNPSAFPSLSPSVSKSLSPSVSKSHPCEIPSKVSSVLQIANHSLPPSKPMFGPDTKCNYLGTSWKTITSEQKEAAIQLGYDECSWENPPFENQDYIEYKPWWNITDDEQDDAMILGCDEASWDSMVHHYYSFYWDDLINVGIEQCAIDLGFTQFSWDTGEDQPCSEELDWKDLNNVEKRGAICLGYKQSTWDAYRMSDLCNEY